MSAEPRMLPVRLTAGQLEELRRQAAELNATVGDVLSLAVAEFCRRCRQIRHEERGWVKEEAPCAPS